MQNSFKNDCYEYLWHHTYVEKNRSSTTAIFVSSLKPGIQGRFINQLLINWIKNFWVVSLGWHLLSSNFSSAKDKLARLHVLKLKIAAQNYFQNYFVGDIFLWRYRKTRNAVCTMIHSSRKRWWKVTFIAFHSYL